MTSNRTFKDQETRNAIGFDVSCQLAALLRMLAREQKQESSHFTDLLNATLPRLLDLTDVVTDISSEEKLDIDEVKKTVYGDEVEAING